MSNTPTHSPHLDLNIRPYNSKLKLILQNTIVLMTIEMNLEIIPISTWCWAQLEDPHHNTMPRPSVFARNWYPFVQYKFSPHSPHQLIAQAHCHHQSSLWCHPLIWKGPPHAGQCYQSFHTANGHHQSSPNAGLLHWSSLQWPSQFSLNKSVRRLPWAISSSLTKRETRCEGGRRLCVLGMHGSSPGKRIIAARGNEAEPLAIIQARRFQWNDTWSCVRALGVHRRDQPSGFGQRLPHVARHHPNRFLNIKFVCWPLSGPSAPDHSVCSFPTNHHNRIPISSSPLMAWSP